MFYWPWRCSFRIEIKINYIGYKFGSENEIEIVGMILEMILKWIVSGIELKLKMKRAG